MLYDVSRCHSQDNHEAKSAEMTTTNTRSNERLGKVQSNHEEQKRATCHQTLDYVFATTLQISNIFNKDYDVHYHPPNLKLKFNMCMERNDKFQYLVS
jgi:hypothetical protein